MNLNKTRIKVYSPWSIWSTCVAGYKTRRRHCLQCDICSNSLRIEVKRCSQSNRIVKSKGKKRRKQNVLTRQLSLPEEVLQRFKGFSPWSKWSVCSKRCTTVRRRICRRMLICGHRVIRQSAYCYVEGGFCHRWIKTRMQRHHDPGYKVIKTLPAPSPAIHSEDTYITQLQPKCGILGHYRGSAEHRRRYHLREMMRIIGGRPTTPGKWPWQVVVLNRYKEAFCGGTLVSLRWVVTAAHCVRKHLYVRLGEYDLFIKDRGEMEMRITEVVVHPKYNSQTVQNDVAMLRLPAPAQPDLGHSVVCLPKPDTVLSPHKVCVILGWGKRKSADVHGTRFLYEAQVSTILQGVCRRSYWQYDITDSMMCAGRGRRDSCAGDSGGPLLCRENSQYYLQGITSFGDGCGKLGKYGIYTRTAGYVPWINDVMAHKYFDD